MPPLPFPETGSFSQLSPAELLRKIFTGKLEGILQVQRGGQKWELRFSAGNLVAARSNLVSEFLSRLALQQKLIQEEHLPLLEQWIAEKPGSPHGEFLRSLGVREEEIRKLLRQQLSQRAARVLLLTEGIYRFLPRKVEEKAEVPPPSPFKIFLDAEILSPRSPELPALPLRLLPGWEELAPELKELPLKTWFAPLLEGKAVPLTELAAGKDPRTLKRLEMAASALLTLGVLAGVEPSQTHPTPEAVSAPKAPTFPENPRLKAVYEELSRKNYFEILGVGENASLAEIKKAYFRLAKEYHPDRHFDPELRRAHPTAEAIFALIVQAYETLSNAERRKEYEELLKRGVSAKEEAELAEKALKSELEFQKGMVFFRKRQWQEALAAFELASSLNPEEGEFRLYALWTRFLTVSTNPSQAQRIAQELENFIRSRKEPPPRAYYFLGRAYKILGEKQRAYEALKEAVRLDPEDREAQQELRYLERELPAEKGSPRKVR